MARYSGLDPKKHAGIRDAAIALFAQYGEKSVTIEQIAHRAGIAKGTVYLYFPSKEALVQEVFWYCHKREADAGDAGLSALPTACDKIKQRVKNIILWSLSHPAESRIQARYYRAHPFSNNGDTPLVLHYNAQKRLIEEALANGELKPLPLPLIGELINSSAAGVITYAQHFPDVLENEALFETMLETLVAGLRA